MAKRKELAGVKELFKLSWERTTSNLEGLIKLLLYSWLGYGLIALVSSTWLVVLGISKRDLIMEAISKPSVLLSSGLALNSVLILVVFALLMMLFSSLIYVVKLQVLTGENEILKVSKKKAQLVLPLIGANLLVSLLVMGGMWLFVLPGMAVYLFTVLASLEVVLAEKGVLEALKASVSKVQARLGKVIVRLLALTGLMLVVWSIPFVLLKSESLGGLLWTVVRVFAGWYSGAYLVELYEQLSALEVSENAKTWWLWLVGILGWILVGGGVFLGIKLLSGWQDFNLGTSWMMG